MVASPYLLSEKKKKKMLNLLKLCLKSKIEGQEVIQLFLYLVSSVLNIIYLTETKNARLANNYAPGVQF